MLNLDKLIQGWIQSSGLKDTTSSYPKNGKAKNYSGEIDLDIKGMLRAIGCDHILKPYDEIATVKVRISELSIPNDGAPWFNTKDEKIGLKIGETPFNLKLILIKSKVEDYVNDKILNSFNAVRKLIKEFYGQIFYRLNLSIFAMNISIFKNRGEDLKLYDEIRFEISGFKLNTTGGSVRDTSKNVNFSIDKVYVIPYDVPAIILDNGVPAEDQIKQYSICSQAVKVAFKATYDASLAHSFNNILSFVFNQATNPSKITNKSIYVPVDMQLNVGEKLPLTFTISKEQLSAIIPYLDFFHKYLDTADLVSDVFPLADEEKDEWKSRFFINSSSNFKNKLYFNFKFFLPEIVKFSLTNPDILSSAFFKGQSDSKDAKALDEEGQKLRFTIKSNPMEPIITMTSLVKNSDNFYISTSLNFVYVAFEEDFSNDSADDEKGQNTEEKRSPEKATSSLLNAKSQGPLSPRADGLASDKIDTIESDFKLLSVSKLTSEVFSQLNCFFLIKRGSITLRVMKGDLERDLIDIGESLDGFPPFSASNSSFPRFQIITSETDYIYYNDIPIFDCEIVNFISFLKGQVFSSLSNMNGCSVKLDLKKLYLLRESINSKHLSFCDITEFCLISNQKYSDAKFNLFSLTSTLEIDKERKYKCASKDCLFSASQMSTLITHGREMHDIGKELTEKRNNIFKCTFMGCNFYCSDIHDMASHTSLHIGSICYKILLKSLTLKIQPTNLILGLIWDKFKNPMKNDPNNIGLDVGQIALNVKTIEIIYYFEKVQLSSSINNLTFLSSFYNHELTSFNLTLPTISFASSVFLALKSSDKERKVRENITMDDFSLEAFCQGRNIDVLVDKLILHCSDKVFPTLSIFQKSLNSINWLYNALVDYFDSSVYNYNFKLPLLQLNCAKSLSSSKFLQCIISDVMLNHSGATSVMLKEHFTLLLGNVCINLIASELGAPTGILSLLDPFVCSIKGFKDHKTLDPWNVKMNISAFNVNLSHYIIEQLAINLPPYWKSIDEGESAKDVIKTGKALANPVEVINHLRHSVTPLRNRFCPDICVFIVGNDIVGNKERVEVKFSSDEWEEIKYPAPTKVKTGISYGPTVLLPINVRSISTTSITTYAYILPTKVNSNIFNCPIIVDAFLRNPTSLPEFSIKSNISIKNETLQKIQVYHYGSQVGEFKKKIDVIDIDPSEILFLPIDFIQLSSGKIMAIETGLKSKGTEFEVVDLNFKAGSHSSHLCREVEGQNVFITPSWQPVSSAFNARNLQTDAGFHNIFESVSAYVSSTDGKVYDAMADPFFVWDFKISKLSVLPSPLSQKFVIFSSLCESTEVIIGSNKKDEVILGYGNKDKLEKKKSRVVEERHYTDNVESKQTKMVFKTRYESEKESEKKVESRESEKDFSSFHFNTGIYDLQLKNHNIILEVSNNNISDSGKLSSVGAFIPDTCCKIVEIKPKYEIHNFTNMNLFVRMRVKDNEKYIEVEQHNGRTDFHFFVPDDKMIGKDDFLTPSTMDDKFIEVACNHLERYPATVAINVPSNEPILLWQREEDTKKVSMRNRRKNKQEVSTILINVSITNIGSQVIVSFKEYDKKFLLENPPFLIKCDISSSKPKASFRFQQIGRNSPPFACADKVYKNSFNFGWINTKEDQKQIVIDPINVTVDIQKGEKSKIYRDNQTNQSYYYEIYKSGYSWILDFRDAPFEEGFELVKREKKMKNVISKSTGGGWFSCSSSIKLTPNESKMEYALTKLAEASFICDLSIKFVGLTLFHDGPLLSAPNYASCRRNPRGDGEAVLRLTLDQCDAQIVGSEIINGGCDISFRANQVAIKSCIAGDGSSAVVEDSNGLELFFKIKESALSFAKSFEYCRLQLKPLSINTTESFMWILARYFDVVNLILFRDSSLLSSVEDVIRVLTLSNANKVSNEVFIGQLLVNAIHVSIKIIDGVPADKRKSFLLQKEYQRFFKDDFSGVMKRFLLVLSTDLSKTIIFPPFELLNQIINTNELISKFQKHLFSNIAACMEASKLHKSSSTVSSTSDVTNILPPLVNMYFHDMSRLSKHSWEEYKPSGFLKSIVSPFDKIKLEKTKVDKFSIRNVYSNGRIVPFNFSEAYGKGLLDSLSIRFPNLGYFDLITIISTSTISYKIIEYEVTGKVSVTSLETKNTKADDKEKIPSTYSNCSLFKTSSHLVLYNDEKSELAWSFPITYFVSAEIVPSMSYDTVMQLSTEKFDIKVVSTDREGLKYIKEILSSK